MKVRRVTGFKPLEITIESEEEFKSLMMALYIKVHPDYIDKYFASWKDQITHASMCNNMYQVLDNARNL